MGYRFPPCPALGVVNKASRISHCSFGQQRKKSDSLSLVFPVFFKRVSSFVFATSVERVDWSALCELCCSLCAGDPPQSLQSAGLYFCIQNWQTQWKPCVTKVSCLAVSKRPIDPTVLAICSSSLGPLVPVTYL